MFPRSIKGAEVPRSEVDVFDKLAQVIDDDWFVFHSVGWADFSRVDGFQQGEIDFVLVHPNRGVFAIEVKGTGVICENGAWYREYDGERKRTKNPFEQAINHEHALRKVIRATDGLEQADVDYGHCVVFPFTPLGLLPPIADTGLVIGKHEFRESFGESLHAILDRTVRGEAGEFTQQQMLILQQRFAPSFAALETLGDEVVDSITGIQALTFEQRAVLDEMEGTRLLDVLGFAGSGKTTLALTKAVRLAQAGKKVAYVCFNRLLAEEKKVEHRNTEGLEVTTFHSLATRLGKRANKLRDLPKGATTEEISRYWEEELPDAQRAAVAELGPQFDALVIDEAQDLSTRMFESLKATLRDPDQADIWIFRDDSQQLFGRELQLGPEFSARRRLTVNCRNTNAIHQELMRFYEGEIKPSAAPGPEGTPVTWIESDDQAATVLEQLRLLKGEEVPTQDVVILAPRPLRERAGSSKGSAVGRALLACECEFTFDAGRQTDFDCIRFESVGAYKGLETPVLIIVEWEGLGGDRGTERENAYVSLSRAQAHCIVIGAKGSFDAATT